VDGKNAADSCKACAEGKTIAAGGDRTSTTATTCAAAGAGAEGGAAKEHKVQGAVTFPLKINAGVDLLNDANAAPIVTALKEGIAKGLSTTKDKVKITKITATKTRRLEEGRRLAAASHSVKVDYEVTFSTDTAAKAAAVAMKAAPAENNVVAKLILEIVKVDDVTGLGFAKSDNTNMAASSFTSSGEVYVAPAATTTSSAGSLASISATSVFAVALALSF
jgi:hypothetical protein